LRLFNVGPGHIRGRQAEQPLARAAAFIQEVRGPAVHLPVFQGAFYHAVIAAFRLDHIQVRIRDVADMVRVFLLIQQEYKIPGFELTLCDARAARHHRIGVHIAFFQLVIQ
jgi:hypothetical protein